MKICSNCKLEKPDEKYYTYYHSVQKKYRTRKICTDCTDEQKRQYRLKKKLLNGIVIEEPIKEEIVQPVVSESLTDVFKDNPDYRKCTICHQYLEKETHFYRNKQTGYYHSMCKICHNRRHKEATQQYFAEKKKNSGGSEKVSNRPNTYQDIYQKEQTFWLMNLLGWTFDEETGVWWKDGIKDRLKQWDKLKNRVKIKAPKQPRKVIDIDKIIELKERGFSNTEISEKLDYTQVTIRKYLKIYRTQNEKSS